VEGKMVAGLGAPSNHAVVVSQPPRRYSSQSSHGVRWVAEAREPAGAQAVSLSVYSLYTVNIIDIYGVTVGAE